MVNGQVSQKRGYLHDRATSRNSQYDDEKEVVRNDRFVRKQLKRGIFDKAVVRNYAEMDRVFGFFRRNGLSKIIRSMQIEKGKQGVMPDLIIKLLFTRALLGNASLNAMKTILKNGHVLRQLRFSWEQIKNGYSKRTKSGSPTAICINTISNDINHRIEPEAWKKALSAQAKVLVRKNMVSEEGVFGIDSTAIIAKGETYEGASKRWITKNKKKQWEYGYKLACLQHLEAGKEFAVAADVKPINEGDVKHFIPLVIEAVKVLGDKLKVLVLDYGYFKYESLARIKSMGNIDFVIHGSTFLTIHKRNEAIQDSVEKWYEVPPDNERVRKQEIAAGPITEDHVLSYEDDRTTTTRCWYLLTRYTNKNGRIGFGGLVTSIPVETEEDCRRIHRLYKLRRPNMENKLFQEMKEGMGLNNLPSRKFNGIFAHLIATCIVYNYLRLYMLQNKEQIEEIGLEIFIRNHLTKSNGNELAVYIGNVFGIFDVGTFAELLLATRSPHR